MKLNRKETTVTDVENDKDEINDNVSITHNEFQSRVEA